jgi:putative peptidoglycan lipid II flippase
MSSDTDNSTEKKKIAKAAGVVGGLNFLSRILGYVRDMVIASFFGAGIHADAFIAAFRIPNLMRRLFGEGTLGIAFVPVFSEYIIRDGEQEAFKLARSALRILVVILATAVLLGILFAPLIVKFVAPGFESVPEKTALAVALTRIMVPYLFFVGLVALSMAILNSLGHFAAPALAPMFLNIAMIAAILLASFFSPLKDVQVTALAVGVLVGGGLQLGLQLPLLKGSGIGFGRQGIFFHPGLKKVGRLILPTLFGSAVYQINILVGTLLASKLPEGSISYLYYADRLVQFPLGIFAVTVGTVVLPTLSRQAAGRDYSGLKRTFNESLRLILFIMLPSTAGLIALREPIVAFLFQRGAFNAVTSQLTADALLYYCLGLWAFAAVRVLLPVFYALQNSWVPVKSAVVSIGANIILSIVLMKPMGHCGLALATSLASILNFVLLLLSLRFRLGAFEWSALGLTLSKSLLGSVIMGSGVWLVGHYVRARGHQTSLLLQVAGSIGIGVALYFSSAKVLRLQELKLFMYLLKKDGKKF